MATLKALIVDPDGTTRETEIENDLAAFQAVVNGYIEPVYGRVGTVYVNEEGLLVGLPANPRATFFVREMFGHPHRLVGTALIVGPADTEGNDTDVRPAVVDYFTKEN
jgi:hypothetical protein